MIAPLISKAIETSQFFLVAVTVPFYIFVLILMIDGQIKRINELNTPFFKLCISSGVIDLSTLFANYFGAMFPKFGLFTYFYMYLDGIYAHIYFCIAWSTGICQAMSVSVLATNRLSAMILPGSYHKMWLSHGLWIAIALQFIPGMLIGCLTFFNTTELVVNENNGIVPTFLKFVKQFCCLYQLTFSVTLTNIFFGIGGFFLLANCLYLTIAYCYLYISLRKRNKAASKNNFGSVYWSKAKAKSRKRERKLFIMSSITVAVQFLILLFFIIRTLQVIELSFDEFYLLYNALRASADCLWHELRFWWLLAIINFK
uniref:G-protein coupled receptors family 1 profile domain-containing protein n=1 Tax=Caenorhabditis japonica TaxID=281687 RepID=A0A8R1I4E1_CAEJA